MLSEKLISELESINQEAVAAQIKTKLLEDQEFQLRSVEKIINDKQMNLDTRENSLNEREEYLLVTQGKQAVELSKIKKITEDFVTLKEKTEVEINRLNAIKESIKNEPENLMIKKDELDKREIKLVELQSLLLKEKAIDRERKEILTIKEAKIKQTEDRLQRMATI